MLNNIKKMWQKKDANTRDDRWIFISMMVGAIFSLIAAFNLSVEAVQLAANPNTNLICDINAIISCGTVARTPFAYMFGFPNGFLALMLEPIIIVLAVQGLVGVKSPRWFMFLAQIGFLLGFIFAYTLFFIGLLIIHAVCPWCLIVTISTTFIFFAMLRYNMRENNLYLPPKQAKWAKNFVANSYDKLILATLIVFDIAILIIHYGNALFA